MRCVHARELLREPAPRRVHARRDFAQQRCGAEGLRFLRRWCSRPSIRSLAGGQMIMRRISFAAMISLAFPAIASAQATGAEVEILRLIGVPHTALGPISLPMPASRNHSYLIGRLQTG